MPVSPEQRKILLERLEMARKAKASKADTAAPPVERKRVAAAKREQPPPPPQEPHQAAEVPKPEPEPKEVSEVGSRTRHDHSDKPAAATKKNKYMKVVFYSEPPKSKVENLLKSLDDSADLEAPTPAKKVPPPRRAAAETKAKPAPKPQQRKQSGDDLEELARLYFS